MNLRNAGAYNIGLDIGTASVGWAVTDENGALLYFKGKPVWGSRLFPEAEKAAEARGHRGQRRRYHRRRWRLDLLQMLFEEAVAEVDPDFFTRLRQSRLHPEDRMPGCSDYHWPFFNGTDFTERDYYARFPTIYHVRQWLMETEEKADIRLIYLAFHNIMKCRGNFLQQDNERLSSKNASVHDAVEDFCNVLTEWCETHDTACEASENADNITALLSNTGRSRSDMVRECTPLLSIRSDGDLEKKQIDKIAKAMASAIVGLSAELADVFFIGEDAPEGLKTKIYLSKDEDVEAFASLCPDDDRPLFETLQKVYSAFVLQEILSARPGESLSANKVAEYGKYGKDLKLLKTLVKEYAPAQYDEFFRGPYFKGTHRYDPVQAQGYTLYNAAHKTGYETFFKAVKSIFKGTAAEQDERYAAMVNELEHERFLRRLKTSDNGSIPFQLHLEEMKQIIERQGRFYPFLNEYADRLCSLVTFRIPYYVGPLTRKNARLAHDAPDGKLRFAWSERLPGKESEKIYPWNWDQIIDKNASAEHFIQRMTGTCTYIHGEPVLPKCSLLYEEFCVLNELNGARFTQDGDREYRFDYAERAAMVDELFKKRRSVTYRNVEGWLDQHGRGRAHVSGGQGEKGFESKLSSYRFFCEKVFEVDELPDRLVPMVEEIIKWNTLFEDRDILRDKLKEKYGEVLDDRQIGVICRKRFTGWGKLSQKFLTGLKAQTDNGPYSIMDILREGNPNNGGRSKAMVLMEILRDEHLDFEEQIDDLNRERVGDDPLTILDELPGSPALRRAIRQALGIVEEIAGIAGHGPANIFIEVTRSDQEKGKRARRRYDALKQALDALKRDNPKWWDQQLKDELGSMSPADLGERATLYFMQGGKSLYSGRPLRFENLSQYQVDHILPQSYIKDDSLDNKALVLQEENQSKSNQMLISTDIQRQMRPYWDALLKAKLISEKKHRNLLRDSVSEKQMKGFINRQLVETSQIVKLTQTVLRERYPEAQVRAIKASLSSELRGRLGLVKCREVNDFHHAHDALLACEIGRFIQKRFPDMFDNPIVYAKAMRTFVKHQSEGVQQGAMPGDSGFIISSFMRSGFDIETGELLHDDWNADEELGRLRRYFDYKQCFISRMPEETSGAFWDATIYSPHDPKKKDQLRLPLKKGLDPRKYGSYSREQFAYFFVYRALKKTKPVLEFAPVPVSVAAAMTEDAGALEVYAEGLAAAKGLKYEGIVREKIYKYQIIEVDGSRLYITGQKEVRNAVQVALGQHDVALVKKIVEGGGVEKEGLGVLEAVIEAAIERYSPRLARALKLGEWGDAFAAADEESQGDVVRSLLAIAAAKTNMIDLTAVGGAKYAGSMNVSFTKLFAEGDTALVDQSITGMFERREVIGL